MESDCVSKRIESNRLISDQGVRSCRGADLSWNEKAKNSTEIHINMQYKCIYSCPIYSVTVSVLLSLYLMLYWLLLLLVLLLRWYGSQ